jgi:acetyl-CoA acetyltransferase
MDFYAAEAREYLDEHGAEPSDLAAVAVKNRENGSRNPLAQYGDPQTIEEVLGARMVVPPLTLPMCSPVTDGAAAVVLCAEELGARVGHPAPKVLASTLVGGSGRGSAPVARAAKGTYETAGLGPADLDVIELHDAAAPAELIQYADIGLCDEGDGYRLIRSGATALDGSIPVNTSGGLMSRGHPLGATGCAQIVELNDQLTGRAAGRQLADARTAMAVNGGGWLDGEYAVAVATILQID